jgi:hypothetical protein
MEKRLIEDRSNSSRPLELDRKERDGRSLPMKG